MKTVTAYHESKITLLFIYSFKKGAFIINKKKRTKKYTIEELCFNNSNIWYGESVALKLESSK